MTIVPILQMGSRGFEQSHELCITIQLMRRGAGLPTRAVTTKYRVTPLHKPNELGGSNGSHLWSASHAQNLSLFSF
jgi:hypothetical protein